MIRPAISAALLLVASPAFANEDGIPDRAGEQVGTEQMVFDTGVEGEANASFLRGLALLHNFEYTRAAAAFREAQAVAPDFVMAYWGEAMTHNHPLWEEQDREAALAVLAKLGATPEERREKARNAREALWLDAVETLYGTDDPGATKEERDHRYLARMRALHEADPDDIDARAFTGLAILGTSHGGRQIPIYMEAAGLLEPGFMTHERHPGILHYLIHSYDDPVHAPLGERQAERYALIAPDAGHAQHMVSHIYHALADWEASERANVLADAVVDRQRAAAGREPTFCGHYNEWLVYARLQQGEDASDIVSGCRAKAMAMLNAGSGEGRMGYGTLSSYARIASWQGVDAGLWPDPVDADGDWSIPARMMMAHGRALANRDDPGKVRAALTELRALSKRFASVLPAAAPDDRTSLAWAERLVAQVEAVEALASGQTQDGLRMLEAAAEAESALPTVFGPPRIIKPSWELLGEQLLEMDRYEEAAEAFRKSLRFAPGRRLSLQGLNTAEGA